MAHLPAELDAYPPSELLPGLQRAGLLTDCDPAPATAEALLAALSAAVEALLRSQSEQLMQLLYRLDIPETYFRDATRLPSLADTARVLAEGILARERLKALTRLHYRQWQAQRQASQALEAPGSPATDSRSSTEL